MTWGLLRNASLVVGFYIKVCYNVKFNMKCWLLVVGYNNGNCVALGVNSNRNRLVVGYADSFEAWVFADVNINLVVGKNCRI